MTYKRSKTYRKRNSSSSIRDQIKANADLILNGTVLAVDPSSGSAGSLPGYALYHEGSLVDSGTLPINYKQPIQKRLAELVEKLHLHYYGHVDLLVIERIRGRRAHEYLKWAVGCTMAAIAADIVIEMSPIIWHKYVGDTHDKGDEADAVAIGDTTIAIAKETLSE